MGSLYHHRVPRTLQMARECRAVLEVMLSIGSTCKALLPIVVHLPVPPLRMFRCLQAFQQAQSLDLLLARTIRLLLSFAWTQRDSRE